VQQLGIKDQTSIKMALLSLQGLWTLCVNREAVFHKSTGKSAQFLPLWLLFQIVAKVALAT